MVGDTGADTECSAVEVVGQRDALDDFFLVEIILLVVIALGLGGLASILDTSTDFKVVGSIILEVDQRETGNLDLRVEKVLDFGEAWTEVEAPVASLRTVASNDS